MDSKQEKRMDSSRSRDESIRNKIPLVLNRPLLFLSGLSFRSCRLSENGSVNELPLRRKPRKQRELTIRLVLASTFSADSGDGQGSSKQTSTPPKRNELLPNGLTRTINANQNQPHHFSRPSRAHFSKSTPRFLGEQENEGERKGKKNEH